MFVSQKLVWLLIIEMLTISWLIDLHLDWQLRRYSKSSSDLVISARKHIEFSWSNQSWQPVAIFYEDMTRRHMFTRDSNDNLTRVGRDRHCRTCRARGRTRGWPVDRSSRSSRWKEPPPSRATLAQPLIARRPASPNTMICEHEIFRALPNLSIRSSHPEEESQRQRSSEITFAFSVQTRFVNIYLLS